MLIYLSLNVYAHVIIFIEEASPAWFEFYPSILPLKIRGPLVALAWVTLGALLFYEIFLVRVVFVQMLEKYKKKKLKTVIRILSNVDQRNI
jgi:hypothetical protein